MNRPIAVILLALLLSISAFSQDCTLSDVDINTEGCNSDGTYDIAVSVSPNNTDFDLFVNGDLWGFYEYDSTAILIDSILGSGIDKDTIVICQNDIDTCCITTVINNPCLCGFAEITADIIDCNEMDSTFSIILDFVPQNNGSGFTIGGNGTTYGTYSYTDIPITLGPISTELQDIEFIFFDTDDVLCFDFIDIGSVDCAIINACNISNVEAVANECNQDGTFSVDVSFDVVNPGSQGFTIQGNGTNYGNFTYGESTYQLGPLNGDCETIYEFVVIDNENNDCSDFTDFIEVICCDIVPCALDDLTIEQGCEPFFGYVIDFNFSGNASDLFDLFIDQMYLGTYAYADLPIISDFGNPTFADEFVDVLVADSDDPACTTSIEDAEIGCEELCSLSGLVVEVNPCEDGTFFIDFEFDANFTSGPTFNLQGNGNVYGTYEYGEMSYSAGPFDGDCETIYEFVIVDVTNPDCQSNGVDLLEPICCEECALSDISIELLECDFEELSFILNFDLVGTSTTQFDVFSRNGIFGTFNFSDLPLTISGFPNTGNEFEFISVCVNDNDECCAEFEWDLEECWEGNLECELSNVEIELLECDEDEMSFVLDFDFIGTTNQSFDVFSRDGFFGFYSFADLPLTITGFPNTGNQFEFIRICENDNDDCCIEFEWDLGDCFLEGNCELAINNVELIECTFNNIWWSVNLDFANTSSTFSITAEGNNYGPFNYADNPITLQIPNQGFSQYSFTARDNDFTDCVSEENITFLEDPCVLSTHNTLNKEDYSFINNELDINTELNVEHIRVYNILGQIVRHNSDMNQITLTELHTGIYLIQVTIDNSPRLIKIFK